MARSTWMFLVATGVVPGASVGGVVVGAPVDVNLSPASQTVCVGEIVGIDLLLSADGSPQAFDTVDAILAWDPVLLALTGFDDSAADVDWFLSGFLPDPEGLNDTFADGDAIVSALAPVGRNAVAPPAPDDLLVGTLQFEVLAETAGVELSLVASAGVLQTRVLLGGAPVTGALGGPVTVAGVQSCPADCALPCDGVVDTIDFLALLAQWGTAGACDIDGSGEVTVVDFLALLGAWGSCPAGP